MNIHSVLAINLNLHNIIIISVGADDQCITKSQTAVQGHMLPSYLASPMLLQYTQGQVLRPRLAGYNGLCAASLPIKCAC